jgi:signal transduction histidine kinase
MERLHFTVDSALLQELGERLVGKPYIALAELVKNSYDADASKATIRFDLDRDCIKVLDDGHGMSFEEFRDFWMRVGTTHKQHKRVSSYLNRCMTGSKGVGRLAVQFLARELTIRTVPQEYKGEWLEAYVDWSKAVRAGDLTEATVECTRRTSSPPFAKGTDIILGKLKHTWDVEQIQNLAGELWWLRPPFRSSYAGPDAARYSFEIDFESTQREFEETFDRQMEAILKIWLAKLVGENNLGQVSLSLQFAGEPPRAYAYNIANFPHNDGKFDPAENLNHGDFEIRLFHLEYRQPHGIRVGKARKYFEKYGGVHVYDGGFHLPYYGLPENDWLRLEFDHAHRKNVSPLLPKGLQVPRGLTHLPTLGRVFGVVNINTADESNLDIMITRDRLAEGNTAFEDLVAMVRYAIDLYANERARREFKRKKREAPTEPTSLKFERVEEVLEYYEPEIPESIYGELRERVQEATTAATTQQELLLKQMEYLGPLATAGISALAYQHELGKQFTLIQDIVERIEDISTDDPSLRHSLNELKEELSSWVERARATNALFDYLADADNAKMKLRLRAAPVLREVKAQTRFLARGIGVDVSKINDGLLFPEATFAEWSAIFQNVFINAFTAMLDSEERLLQVSSRTDGKRREILVQDTGVGVNLKDAERLFQPFERGIEISPARRALGYGGTGLGLTIVQLLADRIGCKIGFVEPDDGFSTAFSISWRIK